MVVFHVFRSVIMVIGSISLHVDKLTPVGIHVNLLTPGAAYIRGFILY